jgi:glycosyltransferase involved in cell wall biosynthesis
MQCWFTTRRAARRIARRDRPVIAIYVDDAVLAGPYATASVVINPQVWGTRLKTKCVEALSAGCAVVMNQAGADGIEEGAGCAFLVAENWDQFGAHILRLLGDAVYRRQFESGARQFARTRFDPGPLFGDLDALLVARLARASSPATSAAPRRRD